MTLFILLAGVEGEGGRMSMQMPGTPNSMMGMGMGMMGGGMGMMGGYNYYQQMQMQQQERVSIILDR